MRPVYTALSHSDRAYELLLGKMLNGTLVPGQSIDFEALMQELYMSRQPIRDAVNRLAVEGMMVVVPQVGCIVGSPSERDKLDNFTIAHATEMEMVALAAERHADGDVRELAMLHWQTEELIGNEALGPIEKIESYRVLNRAFHCAVFAAIDSPAISAYATSQFMRLQVMIRADLNERFADLEATGALDDAMVSGVIDRRNREHFAIIAAIRNRDGAAARAAMHVHHVELMRNIFKFPPEPLERSLDSRT